MENSVFLNASLLPLIMSIQLISSLKLFIKKGLPVVAYRSPRSKKPILIGQGKEILEEIKIADIDRQQGFLISGFSQSMHGKTFIIRPDIVLNSDQMPGHLVKKLERFPDAVQMHPTADYIQTKEAYLESVKSAIQILKSGELYKIVLSRIISLQIAQIDFGKLFSQIEERYPDAFVYLLYLPGKGIWFGATPETLISIDEDSVETVALAGTMPVDRVNWSEKEIEEQELVSEHIKKVLQEEQVLEYERKAPVTVQAGNLAHLKTTFTISRQQLNGKFGNFISRMHPTPAICGLPKEKAFNQIEALEGHNRNFYAGFLGPWNMSEKSLLFVNLRCACLTANRLSLFVGGGITAKSDAEAEWEETVNKSETLLSVLKKM